MSEFVAFTLISVWTEIYKSGQCDKKTCYVGWPMKSIDEVSLFISVALLKYEGECVLVL